MASGAARTARPTRMLPPAPEIFSTIAGWPSDAVICSAIIRAIESACPPAGYGTTMVIEREGYVCAAAFPVLPNVAASAARNSEFLMCPPAPSRHHGQRVRLMRALIAPTSRFPLNSSAPPPASVRDFLRIPMAVLRSTARVGGRGLRRDKANRRLAFFCDESRVVAPNVGSRQCSDASAVRG
jgi:hypothetical protein